MKRSPTPRPLPIRTQGVEVLQALVGATVGLRALVHDAHVNVDGPARGPLHSLFGQLYDALDGLVDVVKERIKTLGGTPTNVGPNGPVPPVTLPSTDGAALCVFVADYLDVYPPILDDAFNRVTELRLTADGKVLQDAQAEIEKIATDVIAYIPS